jgi:hypothetical protein
MLKSTPNLNLAAEALKKRGVNVNPYRNLNLQTSAWLNDHAD